MTLSITRPHKLSDFAIVSTVVDGKTNYARPWGAQSDPIRYSMAGAREEVARLKYYVARCKRAGQQPIIRPNCIVRVYLK